MSSAVAPDRPIAIGPAADSSLWPVEFRPVVDRLIADGQRYFGARPIAVEPLSRVDRPYSTLMRVRIAGESESSTAFIKILKPRADTAEQIASMRLNVAKDFEMTSRVSAGLAAYPGLGAVRPIACFPEALALVTEEAPGVSLSDLLTRRAAGWPRKQTIDELRHLMALVGTWLRAVQDAIPPDKEIGVQWLRTYLDTRLTTLQQSRAFRLTAAGRGAIERYRDRLIAETGDGEIRNVWIHADFCPENIIVATGNEAERITVLDFTMAKTGTVYHDVAHLYMQLELMLAKPWFRRHVVSQLQTALLESFEPGLRPEQPLFALMLLQHVTCHLVALQQIAPSPLAGLYAARVRRMHRRWLSRVVGLDERSWER
jgi:hypothetical protein